MKEYTPSEIEAKWQAIWEREKPFKTPATPGAKKAYILDMFPYPSGAGLHIGHPLGYTGTDIYARFKRAQGYSVLHPMGYDAFGLPAEQHAVNTGEHPSKITFESCANFTKQLKRIGFSYDWDREIQTCVPEYYQWTQWIFLKLYNSWFDAAAKKARPISELPIPAEVSAAGVVAVQEYQAKHRLAFMAESMVNWCPALGTVLANEEIIDGRSERGGHDVVRKPMRQWMMRITAYADRLIEELEGLDWPEAIKEQQRNWIGKRFGTEVQFAVEKTAETITAFTTRADTLCGVTFVVVSPEHLIVDKIVTADHRAAVAAYRDAASKLSDFDRTIENRKKTGCFTGAYAINPISGARVPVYVADYVLMTFGTGMVMGVPAHDERDFEFAALFKLPVIPVIAPRAADFPGRDEILAGKLPFTEEGVMLPNTAAVAKELALEGKPNLEAQKLITGWLTQQGKGRAVTTYRLRDWVFSRQRYWGEPIPIVHWEDGTTTALTESELPLVLPEVADYKPSEGGESPLAKAPSWLNVVDPKNGKKGRRETNTMPQWAGSCWYYLRFIDPHNKTAPWDRNLEKGWMNVDLYVGGAEHAVLHLLYSRFWHKVLFDLGFVSTKEPFQKLFNQGMIQAYAYKDTRGALVATDLVADVNAENPVHRNTGEKLERIVAKMSKSLKNVVNPDTIISEFGADTLRMYLMFRGPLDSSGPWDPKAIQGVFRFLRRSWMLITGDQDIGHVDAVSADAEDVAVTRAIHKATKKVTSDLEGLQFNTAVSTLMECLNEIAGKPLSLNSMKQYVQLLAPLAPHLAEELWERLGNKSCVGLQPWPTFDAKLLEQQSVMVVVQVKGKKRATVEVAPNISEPELQKIVAEALAGGEYAAAPDARFITVYQSGTKIPKLVNVV